MAQDKPTSGIEVEGRVISTLIASVEVVRPEVQRILAAHGISAASPRPWYPLEDVLRCVADVQERVGLVTLRAVGQQVPRHTAYPPQLTTFPMALFHMNAAYQRNHRGPGNIGGYHHEPVDGESARMRCDNPYPCEFNQGVLEGLHARFAARGARRLRIEHDPASCRTQGGSSCLYHLKW